MNLLSKHSLINAYWFRTCLITCVFILFSGQTLKRSIINTDDNNAKLLTFSDKDKIKSKIATRKKVYKVGELLSLDIAILNLSDENFFFPNISSSRIKISIFDADDNYIGPYYYETSLGITSKSFSIIYPNEIFTESINLLVGCEESDKLIKRKVKILQETQLDKVNERGTRILEENAFISMGSGCVKISKPGNYKVLVKIENRNKVVFTEAEERTFIGQIELSPLFITVNGKD